MRRSLLLVVLACTFLTMAASANSGLNYSYYEGNWTAIPDFSTLTATKTGTSSNVDLGVRNRDTYFSVLWQGYINIPADGVYTFELNSDDGSKFYLGNYNSTSLPLISNDGLHSAKTVANSQYLYKGIFPIAISYLQGAGVNTMEFYWSSTTGISRQRVPDNVLLSNYTGLVSSYSGLNYSVVQGSYKALPDFFTQNKVKTGNSANVDLNVSNSKTQYAILWEGFITIPADGTYTFETNSDDGSKLYLGAYNNGMAPLINNDGDHSPVVKKGTTYLSAGVYPITISYYQGAADQVMEVYWSSTNGISRQLIPDNAFKSGASIPVTTTPTTPTTTGSGPINYNYYEGGYSSMPDVFSLTPVKSGTSSSFDLGVRNRNEKYVMMWQTNITLPANGIYTFETVSDDGSKLYLGDFTKSQPVLVNNDGEHGAVSKSASMSLNAGVYTLTVLYFQNTLDASIDVYWSSNSGISRQPIPLSVMSAVATTTTPVVTAPVVTTPVVTNPIVTAPTLTAPDVSNEANESGGLTGAHNYYFSSTTGDDARSSAQAQSPSTPWRTLAKLNSVLSSLATGDAVLLKRGDVFDGSLSVGKSNVIFSAYGTGTKPVINGFTTLGNWINQGYNIWASSSPYNGSRINMLTINGAPAELGRYPNSTDKQKGYVTYTSHTFNASTLTGSVTAGTWNNGVNWTGAELAIRKCRWIIDKCPVTYQSGSTFYYNSPSDYTGADGFGFFIQNHPATLDQFGEWYWNPSTKYMQVHFAGNNPNNYTVKASVVDILVSATGQSNITFDNLAFEGANVKVFEIGGSNNVTITNCRIANTGKTAINVNNANNLNVSNCTIRNTNNTAMYLGPGVSNSTISNNLIVNTGMFAGMGESNTDARSAFTIAGSNNLVQYNEIDSTGHTGIKFIGNNVTIRNNLVNYFCSTSDDGAGIYTYNRGFTGRVITGNIVVNAVGASDGTDSYTDYAANGIGVDDYSTNVELSNNSIANCNGRGMGLHNSHELIVKGNTAYNCDMAQMEYDHDKIGPNDPIRNATMTDNIFVSKKADQDVFTVRTKEDDIAQYGYFNSNYYCRPIDDKLTFSMYSYYGTDYSILRKYDLVHWKGTYQAYDGNSHKSPVAIAPYSINSTSGNMYPNQGFDASIKNVVSLSPDRNRIQYDNSALDGGSLKVTYLAGSTSKYNAIWFYDNTNPYVNPTLLAGHTYRVKFSIKGGSNNNPDFMAALQSATGAGSPETKVFKVYNTRQEVELLFKPTANVPTSYVSIWTDDPTSSPVYWIDNMIFQEVYSISYTNPDDYMRFEYNASTSNRTIGLDGLYTDMKGNLFNYAITLAPYTSAVLVKKGSSLVTDVSNSVVEGSVSSASRVASTVLETAAAPDNSTAALDLKLTPNPAVSTMQLRMSVPGSENKKATLTIYSASGTAVSTREVSVTGQPLTIDVSTLSRGMYTINLVCGKQVISRKFVKM